MTTPASCGDGLQTTTGPNEGGAQMFAHLVKPAIAQALDGR